MNFPILSTLIFLPLLSSIFIFLTRPSILSIDGNEYYLRYPTKKHHIVGYWIASVLVILLFLGIFAISLIAAI